MPDHPLCQTPAFRCPALLPNLAWCPICKTLLTLSVLSSLSSCLECLTNFAFLSHQLLHAFQQIPCPMDTLWDGTSHLGNSMNDMDAPPNAHPLMNNEKHTFLHPNPPTLIIHIPPRCLCTICSHVYPILDKQIPNQLSHCCSCQRWERCLCCYVLKKRKHFCNVIDHDHPFNTCQICCDKKKDWIWSHWATAHTVAHAPAPVTDYMAEQAAINDRKGVVTKLIVDDNFNNDTAWMLRSVGRSAGRLWYCGAARLV